MKFSDAFDNEDEVISIPDIDENDLSQLKDLDNQLPILPLRNTVLFPRVVIPIHVSRKKSIKLLRSIYKKSMYIGTVSQIEIKTEDPSVKDINTIGTVARIIKILQMPDDTHSVVLQGISRFNIKEFISESPYFVATIERLIEIRPEPNDTEFSAIVSSLKDLSLRIIELSPNIPRDASFAVKNIENPSFLINFISSNSDLDVHQKQMLLEANELKQRGLLLMKYLEEEIQKLELKNNIQHKVRQEIDKQQKEYYLNQQIKTIQTELGHDNIQHEIDDLENRAKKKKWSKQINETFQKELKRLQRINPASPDYSIHLNYIQTLLDLPWNEYTKDNFDMKRAERILDEDHFGLDKVKERILEYLAVLKLKGDLKSPIICLYGPPGVGKTSLGKSIASALGRKYIRMSLGGLHDEAEIRGHRKTYIGALPGRIIQGIRKSKSANPVFILDEIDKVGNDFRGDPSSALLEVLDPEQNSAFYDNYLELEFDLSKVMFIATANSLSSIKPALLDRMELINVTGYIIEEKIEIAKQHLVPKQMKAHGLKKNQLRFTDKILETIIEQYTRESGVRELDKTLASIVRKIAKKIAFKENYPIEPTIDFLYELLGVPHYIKDKYIDEKNAGVVTGLAWTATGGEILFIETSLSQGIGKLTITGNLGNVMKESAILALEYLKAHAQFLEINPNVFKYWNVHLHVPEGAIPKDGPSAGITMVTSIASAFTQRLVKANIALTGEITLRGKVLPVGGIKEKILAAKRAGITEIILSKENKKDVEDIKDIYRKNLMFHYVETIQDVLNIALTEQKSGNAKKIGIPKKKE